MPYEAHMGISNIKQELPGSFTSIQTGPAFRASPYESNSTRMYAWGHPNSQGPSMQTQPSSIEYNGSMDITYMPGNGGFHGSGTSQFASANPAAQYLQPNSAVNADVIYTDDINGHVPHLTQTSYAGDQPFQVSLDAPHFSTPQYMSPGGVSAQQQQQQQQQQVPTSRAMAMQYDVNGGLSYPQVSDNPANYHHQQEQQQYYPYQMR